MNMKAWIIKKLGGVTKEEQERLRKRYEVWAIEYLTGKNGEVTPDFAHYFPFDGDDICVIRSRISISNARITGLKIAPWCREVSTSGLRT